MRRAAPSPRRSRRRSDRRESELPSVAFQVVAPTSSTCRHWPPSRWTREASTVSVLRRGAPATRRPEGAAACRSRISGSRSERGRCSDAADGVIAQNSSQFVRRPRAVRDLALAAPRARARARLQGRRRRGLAARASPRLGRGIGSAAPPPARPGSGRSAGPAPRFPAPANGSRRSIARPSRRSAASPDPSG